MTKCTVLETMLSKPNLAYMALWIRIQFESEFNLNLNSIFNLNSIWIRVFSLQGRSLVSHFTYTLIFCRSGLFLVLFFLGLIFSRSCFFSVLFFLVLILVESLNARFSHKAETPKYCFKWFVNITTKLLKPMPMGSGPEV